MDAVVSLGFASYLGNCRLVTQHSHLLAMVIVHYFLWYSEWRSILYQRYVSKQAGGQTLLDVCELSGLVSVVWPLQ